ncbi:Bestrophin, RFP-TM, chloride channel-domain-containing protein [Suillus bovinus]|uniref:Bestrophin, RFP-TM, chloride channel-domain-containing protein n=1 Tax=Suillus bovinus TaxID=48563 RepID=UPI001B87BD23|nr:Bestrophin, RFP-TM, chloride channel-domain-containing protein [Suillus bovinus]KAG2136348.1 Bestrophin, RFP-TM, chloride channel-domain-containing protein [Suillus bovinus]
MSKIETTTYDSFESTLAVHRDKPLTWCKTFSILWGTVSTTALTRCWPALIGTIIWSSSICVLNYYTHGIWSIQPTVITVFGTVLGFIISFRTSSSFERYNEGAKLWSDLVLNCRIFARTVWFHVPDNAISVPPKDCHHTVADEITNQDLAKTQKEHAMTLIEKKTVVNLLEAYAVATKHYLRGEEGIHYKDLYPLVPFLSSSHYSFPAIIPFKNDEIRKLRSRHTHNPNHDTPNLSGDAAVQTHEVAVPESLSRPVNRSLWRDTAKTIAPPYYDPESLLPAELPPRRSWRSASPFPVFFWTSYICALQTRKTVSDPTLDVLTATLNQLVGALTGLERILATPIPFSYSSHLWMITMLYLAAWYAGVFFRLQLVDIVVICDSPSSYGPHLGGLLFQRLVGLSTAFLWPGKKLKIRLASFLIPNDRYDLTTIYLIGYGKNDLNLRYLVENIIRESYFWKELRAITSTPAPNIAIWAFSKENNFLQVEKYSKDNSDKTPQAWVDKGKEKILNALYV